MALRTLSGKHADPQKIIKGRGAAINPEEDVVLLYLTGRTNAAHELAFTMPPPASP